MLRTVAKRNDVNNMLKAKKKEEVIMAKYKVFYSGELWDEVFDTEEEAEEYALELVSCSIEGAEILHMSNPGDYDEDDYEEDYEIVEIDGD